VLPYFISPQGTIALQLLRSYFLTSTHVYCSASSTIIALLTKIINFKLHDMASSTHQKHNLSTTQLIIFRRAVPIAKFCTQIR